MKRIIEINGKKYKAINENAAKMADNGQVGLLVKLAARDLKQVFMLHKQGNNEKAKEHFNMKVYSTIEYIYRAFDNIKKRGQG
jgi:regulatory protein YycI of two-component signal transduction system YycFG